MYGALSFEVNIFTVAELILMLSHTISYHISLIGRAK
jgi:hypothetical protein